MIVWVSIRGSVKDYGYFNHYHKKFLSKKNSQKCVLLRENQALSITDSNLFSHTAENIMLSLNWLGDNNFSNINNYILYSYNYFVLQKVYVSVC